MCHNKGLALREMGPALLFLTGQWAVCMAVRVIGEGGTVGVRVAAIPVVLMSWIITVAVCWKHIKTTMLFLVFPVLCLEMYAPTVQYRVWLDWYDV